MICFPVNRAEIEGHCTRRVTTRDLTCTQKCRFMSKEVREISRFFVAPPRVFAPSSVRLHALPYPEISSTLVKLRNQIGILAFALSKIP